MDSPPFEFPYLTLQSYRLLILQYELPSLEVTCRDNQRWALIVLVYVGFGYRIEVDLDGGPGESL